jgi:hypothetical protein
MSDPYAAFADPVTPKDPYAAFADPVGAPVRSDSSVLSAIMGVPQSTVTGSVPAPAPTPAPATPSNPFAPGGAVSTFVDSAGKAVAIPGRPDLNLTSLAEWAAQKLPASLGGGTPESQEATLAAGANSHPLAALTGDLTGRAVGAYSAGNLAGGALGAAGTAVKAGTEALAGATMEGGKIAQGVASTLTNPTLDKFISAVAEKVAPIVTNAARGAGALPEHPEIGAAVGAAASGAGAVNEAAAARLAKAVPVLAKYPTLTKALTGAGALEAIHFFKNHSDQLGGLSDDLLAALIE